MKRERVSPMCYVSRGKYSVHFFLYITFTSHSWIYVVGSKNGVIDLMIRSSRLIRFVAIFPLNTCFWDLAKAAGCIGTAVAQRYLFHSLNIVIDCGKLSSSGGIA